MKKRTVSLLTIVLTMLATLVFNTSSFSQPPTPPEVGKLGQDADGEVEITWNPRTDAPSFIRGRIPLSVMGLTSEAAPATAASALVDRYADLFGVRQASHELNIVQTEVDDLGMKHVTMGQVYQGVEVYGAYMKVHLSADSREVMAISSGFVPDIRLLDTQPHISADQALTTAQKALLNGTLISGPKLAVYPGAGKKPGASAKLVWLVELRDDSIPARNVYVVDAITGGILDVLSRLYEQAGGPGQVAGQSIIPTPTPEPPKPPVPTPQAKALSVQPHTWADGRVVVIIELKDQPLAEAVQPIRKGYWSQAEALQREYRSLAPASAQAHRSSLPRDQEAAQIEPPTSAQRELVSEIEMTLGEMRRAMVEAARPALDRSQAPVVAAVEAMGGQVIYRYMTRNAIAAAIPPGVRDALAARPDVTAVTDDRRIDATLDVSASAIYAPTWWSYGYEGGPWDVAIIDSGVDNGHPAFSGHIVCNGVFLDAAGNPSWDSTSDDVNGHGTHVAGIVSSTDSTYRGVAYGHDKIINVKAAYDVDGPDGGGASMYWSDAMAGVDWAYFTACGDDADVMNLSYGSAAWVDDDDYNRFWDAVVDGLLMPVSIAAGNDNTDGSPTVHAPSIAYNVISIANVDDNNTVGRSDDAIRSSSSRGPSPGGRKKPDLAAPGSNILSADNSWDAGGSNWIAYWGTSMAAPHITGAQLLLLNTGVYSPRVQKALLINTSEDMGTAGWDSAYGWGYLDLGHAYFHRYDWFTDYISPAPAFKLYKGPMFPAERATLVWNRRVGYAGASSPSTYYSLSDLDLYMYDEYSDSIVDASISSIDNVEVVEADVYYSTAVLKVDVWSSSFDGTSSEYYTLATEENLNVATGPAFTAVHPLEYVIPISDTFNVTVAITNTGDLIAHNVYLGLDLPAEVSLVSGSNPQHFGRITPSASVTGQWTLQSNNSGTFTVPINIISYSYGETFTQTSAFTLRSGRYRETYDANHTYSLPGTLVRSEGDGPIGDQDVDNAHDFAGTTYDYYYDTHSRNSYDDQGATIVSTANYGRSYMNAFWNGEQVVYGDEFPVRDIVAHELTHAVTEHSANLEYRWQSGALNESFSDIFGAMVDRDDWLMGEDLPPNVLGGREAVRDLSDPPRFGQPDHTDDWVETCSDNEGVHTNSGIPNKAYYNIATAVGKDKAERIFYRVLVTYLQPTSSLEDARAAALQAAQDLYGSGSAEYNAVENGFNAVGLDGVWNPAPNDCTCAASTVLSDEEVYPDRASALQVATTLYRVRDQLLSTTPTGQHYRALYEQYTGRINALLLRDAQLRATGGQILQRVTPGLGQLNEGGGDEEVVTQEMVSEVLAYLQRLIDEARANGDEELAQTIEREMARIDWDHLIGMTFEEAWAYIRSRITVHPYPIYLPVVLK